MSNISSQCKVAVFDVDGTLIHKNIGVTFVKFLVSNRRVGICRTLLIAVVYLLYKVKLLDFKYAIYMGCYAISGMATSEVESYASDCFNSFIRDSIYAGAILEINRLKSDSYVIILATGAHSSIAKVFSSFLKADELVCTDSEIINDHYTLNISHPLPYKDGKRVLVLEILKKYNPCSVSVYTDEKKDIPLLTLANNPIGVNADAAVAEFVTSAGGKLITFA